MATLGDSLTLKSGTVLRNRICKASMNEALATPDGKVTDAHVSLYEAWADSGASLLITGNMMVDGKHMNEPLVVDALLDTNMDLLRKWAATGKRTNTHIWPQLNHPGKQSPKMVNDAPLAPSVVPIPNDMFAPPRELTDAEIEGIIDSFAEAAARLEEAGFTGVQLHGAHGYLIGQFLSPHHNRREDKWGGSFENRFRFVEEIYNRTRARTGPGFNVGIKINSSDFQKGGFTEEDSIEVAKRLDKLGIDLIEISGGSWENPVNRKGKQEAKKESTLKREAYFLEYAEKVKSQISTPLVVTGGFRSSEGMSEALGTGAMDMAGVARPFAVDPKFGKHVMQNNKHVSPVAPIRSGLKKIDAMAIMEISWYTMQIERISQGKKVQTKADGIWPALRVIYRFWKNGKAVKRVRA
ncbi:MULTISPECIES: NADH:flavin oxidoreductase/NADH oxidase family protein [unclassified Shimia]|uniref:NADH:flavin oxidoreductase/NADH oxidase family protein n=1 Tax=unclassified Shimia TaxID=2630038 RepID=UPI001AD985C6|nr:NADH:flavin oxidoreductase/NADH oxidase family protein [Shimia sp. R9_3]MBO9399994.1 NADH:flavin oxidoreductase/NADH oxidase family protein [Shimia sp. R9_3]